MKLFSASTLERLPWPIRVLLGCCAAAVAVGLTYAILPFRAFPLLLAFPTVVLSAWFLGMGGAALCAFTDAVLVDLFLTKTQFRFSVGFVREEIRLAVFLVVSLLLGWAIRRLAHQRTLLRTRELQQRLTLADAERQLAEERARASEALRDRDDMLQLAVRANGLALWDWDLHDNVMHWSDERYRLVGREPGSIAPSPENWLQFVHPEDAADLQEALARSRRDGADYYRQYRVLWPDGSIHWIESQGRCQRDSEGGVKRIIGVATDITARRQAEEAILRAEKLAVAGRLAASIAHEINNPLEAVANLLYLIAQTESVEEAREHAQVALDEIMRISLITQQTLKFHRQAGRPKSIQLSDIVETVLVLFRGRLASAQISVQVRPERELPIECMPGEVQQVFANLAANAIEAMPGGGRLVVRLRPSHDWRAWNGRHPSATRGMRITFADSGGGMDRATMRRIFEPFFTTKEETGTGLGMWVVAQLIERHHGHLRVYSSQRPGRTGTTISIFLPLEPAPSGTAGA
jgi:PAS domain S-box-containing protein